MIRRDACREFALYQARLTKDPPVISYYFNLPDSPHIYQYHNTGKELFAAIFDKCNSFRAYIPKVELN